MDYVEAIRCLDEQRISISAYLQGRSIDIHFPLPALVMEATLEADIVIRDSASFRWRSAFEARRPPTGIQVAL